MRSSPPGKLLCILQGWERLGHSRASPCQPLSSSRPSLLRGDSPSPSLPEPLGSLYNTDLITLSSNDLVPCPIPLSPTRLPLPLSGAPSSARHPMGTGKKPQSSGIERSFVPHFPLGAWPPSSAPSIQRRKAGLRTERDPQGGHDTVRGGAGQ